MNKMSIKIGEKKFWDRISKDVNREQEKVSDAIRGDILEEYSLNKTYRRKFMLEICCGTGQNANIIADKAGASVVGIDISSETIKIATRNARNRAIKAYFIVADAENLPFHKNVFDVVFAINALHHLPNPEKSIAEMHRVLKLGGETIMWKESGGFLSKFKNSVTFPIMRNLFKSLCLFNRFPICSPIEENNPVLFSFKWLYKSFKDAGFSEINVRGAEYLMSMWSIFIRSPPKFLLRFMIKIDKYLSHIPIIRGMCFTIRVTAKKTKSANDKEDN